MNYNPVESRLKKPSHPGKATSKERKKSKSLVATGGTQKLCGQQALTGHQAEEKTKTAENLRQQDGWNTS